MLLTSNLNVSSTVDKANGIDGLARVISLILFAGLCDVQTENAVLILRHEPAAK